MWDKLEANQIHGLPIHPFIEQSAGTSRFLSL